MTEMFISTFYAVIDPWAGALSFANAGHPHAFLLTEDGKFERLEASGPPIGMEDKKPKTGHRAWNAGRDLLVLFTDGVSDARNRAGDRLGEERILETIRVNRHEPPSVILECVSVMLDDHTKGAVRRDDLTLVLVRS
jgi:sigma-B regulation protein RsbU (phosphoserine phosphatase)